MVNTSTASIPIEIMDLLNRINDNINDVKERIARIEAVDHSDSIKEVKQEIEKERDKRIALEIELASVKTRLAPIVGGIALAGAVLLEVIIKSFQ